MPVTITLAGINIVLPDRLPESVIAKLREAETLANKQENHDNA